MSDDLRALIDAPLANPAKINLPAGRRSAPRVKMERPPPRPGDLTPAQVRERKAKALSAKQELLLDYYATTEIPASRIADHVGLFHQVQTGTDKQGKPIYTREPDVKRVEAALKWRRAK